MADSARILIDGNYHPIEADIATDRSAYYVCANLGCNARMFLVSPGSEDAHFRSRSVNDHKFAACIRQSISFHPDKYDESLFRYESFKNNLLHGTKKTDIHARRGSGGTVDSGRNIPLNTLRAFYAACRHAGIGGTYGDCRVSEVLCCEENFNENSRGFSGFKVVDATYYHAVPEEHAIVFNYPCFTRDPDRYYNIKVFFPDENDRIGIIRHYKRISGKPWLSPIVLAADWTQAADGDGSIRAVATIHKRSQHVFINGV